MSALIVLEGVDAVGKATQAKLLLEKLDSIGRSAVLFSFPRYETEAGKAIRRLLVGETRVLTEEDAAGETYRAPEEPLILQSLMLADKCEAVNDMGSAAQAGSIVICDRWTQSALCFGEADGLDPAWLQRTQEYLPNADLNILLDVPEDEALLRRPQLRDRYEKDREKQKVVRANYKTLWEAGAEEDSDCWVTIDGVGTVGEIATRIWAHVLALLGLES